MKKILFSVFAVAAVMTACSKSDVVDAPNIDTPISFEAYSGKVPVTKATSIDGPANLASEGGFKVHAYKATTSGNTYVTNYATPYSLMDGISVTGNESGTEWDYEGTIFWPNDSEDLTFVAYNNSSANVHTYSVAGAEGAKQPVLSVVVPTDVTAQQDVLVATTSLTKSNNVALEFNHILSRVYFEVNANRDLQIKSVTLSGDFCTEGTYNIAEGKYDTKTASATTYSLITNAFPYDSEDGKVQIVDGEATNVKDYYMMIIPCGVKEDGTVTETPNAKITIVYQFEGEGNLVYTATQELGNEFFFEEAKSYKFLLNMLSQEISFSVTVKDWEEQGTNGVITLAPTVSAEVVSNGENA